MVNMTDFNNKAHSNNVTKSIFDRQRELMSKYESIEEANGLLETPDVPVDIDSYKGQARLKNFAWRVTEELTEALEPIYVCPEVLKGSDEYIHMIEEYIDAVHFLAELAILSGIDPVENRIFNYGGIVHETIPSFEPSHLVRNTMAVIENLGLAMNCLKNKPWKQTHVTTDEQKYKTYIVLAGRALTLMLYVQFGLQGDDLLNCYLNKADVNKFRQESGY